MASLRRAACWAIIPLFFIVAGVSADEQDIERLIDQLVEVSEPGFGYSVFFSGSEFLPYENTGEMSTLVLGAEQAARSEALRKLVEVGAAAVPVLLRHIDDDRLIKMEPLKGMEWMSSDDEYDFNSRTTTQKPQGVNRDWFKDSDDRPDEHAVTVGDLCFVALGQIVNRQFSATRYQPTGGLVISSPTSSEAFRKVILDDWKGLTAERHKELLIEDFLKPDYEGRRTGAYLRLAFYYPDAVEKLVLDELSKPTFDVFAIEDLCRNTLYKTEDKATRQAKYDEFISVHGDVSSAGVIDQLFEDLYLLEAHERGGLSPPLTRFGTQPRELLIQLFGYPATVTSADRPVVESASESERARFIETLVHDDSQEIAEAVKQLFLANADDDYFASACLRCLASRGNAAFLTEQLERIDLHAIDVNVLHLHFIEAISTSQQQTVRDKLLEIVRSTQNALYFMAALPTVDRDDDELVLDEARRVLAGLPDDINDAYEVQSLLQMIGERFPDEAKAIYRAFLATGGAQRAETMCRVLWYSDPLAIELLAPLLDDQRELPGFSIPMRVCDRAAQAISHTSPNIRFDSEWSTERKDRQIEVLKKYCQDAAK